MPDVDHQVTPVLCHLAVEPPLLLVGALVHQPVFGLVGAQPVVIQLVIVVGLFERGPCRRVVTAVEKALVPGIPAGTREFNPLNPVRQIHPIQHPADMPGLPVRAGIRQAVSQVLAVPADSRAAQGDRAIFGEGVGVDQHLRVTVQVIKPVKHVLVLQAVVGIKEIPPSPFERR